MKNILFGAIIVMVITSCNNTQTQEKDTKDTDKLKVFVVNYPLYYFAERIGGESIELIYPIPNGVDPAYWVPDQSLADIQSCDLILANGADYAKWMAKVSLPASKIVNTSEADTSRYIRTEQGTTHSHGGSGEHVHADYAFTTWLDFSIAMDQAEAIKNALVKHRPTHAEVFTDNFEALKSELTNFDKSMVEIGANFQGQTLFASHPVYQYLAQAYGLDIISEHWEPGETPSDEQWTNFKSNLSEHPATVMLWEGKPSEEVTSSLLELGVTIVLFNPCGNKPAEGDFVSVMNDNINGLKP